MKSLDIIFMAHIIAVGEGYSDGLKRFEEHFNGRMYSDNKCKVRVREIKLYHFSFNECGRKEVIADLKSISRYNQDKVKNAQKGTTTALHVKFQKYLKFFRKFFKMIQPIEDELDASEMGTFKQEMDKKGIIFNMALHPIGLVNDYRDLSNNVEMV